MFFIKPIIFFINYIFVIFSGKGCYFRHTKEGAGHSRQANLKLPGIKPFTEEFITTKDSKNTKKKLGYPKTASS